MLAGLIEVFKVCQFKVLTNEIIRYSIDNILYSKQKCYSSEVNVEFKLKFYCKKCSIFFYWKWIF